MRATSQLLVASHPDCREHVPFPGHPERGERLDAAVGGAAVPGVRTLAVEVDAPRVLAAISRVHARSLASRLERACAGAPGIFDCADNPISAGTYTAALAAVSASLAGADAVAAEPRDEIVWVPVRPPGHHALPARAMGYCFFNNVAVAAAELVARGVAPVAIVDFDVHHGNGTQEIFWERDDVYYFSVHRYPFYPGTGAGDEIGARHGRGFTHNLPLAVGADDPTYSDAVAAGLEQIVSSITPRAWVVSAGFDAHYLDPLGGMMVTEAGFARIGALLRGASSGTPVLAVLEGGYNLEALRRSVRAFLEGMSGTATP